MSVNFAAWTDIRSNKVSFRAVLHYVLQLESSINLTIYLRNQMKILTKCQAC